MKNNRSYRLPALLLAVIMILSILPIAAVAENVVGPIGGTYFYTVKNAEFTYFSGSNTVKSVEELNPNQTSTMMVTVPDSEGLPQNNTGEMWVAIPENVKITMADAASCKSEDVTCIYRPETNRMVFKWKNTKKAGFTAILSIAPDVPSTVNLSGRYVIASVKADQTPVGAVKAQMRNDKRLCASVLGTYEDKLLFDDNAAFAWTFTKITGDWYTISCQGSYLKMDNNALSLTDKGSATVFHIRSEANGYVIESNGYYLNIKGDNPSNGAQGSNWSPMAQWIKLYPASELFDPTVGDNGYIKLNANGGNVTIQPDVISAKIGDVIKLPDYAGKKNNKQFIGWAPRSNIYDKLKETGNSYCEVYLPGSDYTVQPGQTILYAVYNEKPMDVRFGIRIDGTIPTEPGDFDVKEYTAHDTIPNAVKIGRWVVDVDSNKSVEGNHIANNVTANLNAVPTDEQIQKAIKAEGNKVVYDPETMYVHWYVLKYAGQWKMDGVLRIRDSKAVAYDINMVGENRNYIQNIPNGFEFGQHAEIAVGAEKDGNVKEPSLKGYTFIGWNTKADGTGITYESGEQVELNDSITFYAQWTKIPTFKVAYENNTAAENENVTKEYMAGETVPLATPPMKVNHIFAGWSVNGEHINGLSFVMPQGDVLVTPEYYGPIYIEIESDWPDDKPGYYGAIVNLTAKVTGMTGMDYTLQWQYKDGETWVNQPDANAMKLTYELTEETSGRIWRAIVTSAVPHQD